MSKNFALVGAAGYIAPRHLQAIKETENRLVAALDPSDSVGILDRFFPDADFFLEFERFDRHIDKLRRKGTDSAVDYVSICSPNYLHDAHIRFALRNNADAICEKPLVLNPWNLDHLTDLEVETGKRIFTILQLRLHPSIVELKEKLSAEKSGQKRDIVLTYITSRGNWYHYSWKGDVSKSGGVATNIGIHFFDMLAWLFGRVRHQEVHHASSTRTGGFIELENARVRWFLSLDRNDLPADQASAGKTTFRSLTMDGHEVEFSDGFTDLHTESYRRIVSGNGFGLDDARPSITLAYQIRNSQAVTGNRDRLHPILAKRL